MTRSLKSLVFSIAIICSMLTLTEAYGQEFSWPVPDCDHVGTGFNKSRGTTGYIHSGLDISCKRNDPIVAIADGTIAGVVRLDNNSYCEYNQAAGTCLETNPTYPDKKCPSNGHGGNYISIDHGNGLISFYMHMKSFAEGLKYGTPVKCGQQIGIMGSTGCSTETHLHFAVTYRGEYVDPNDYVQYGAEACVCISSEEICDGKDNDCDGEVDEDNICALKDEIIFKSMMFDKQSTDINGDGKADICARGYGGLYCALNVAAGNKGISNVLSDLGDDNGYTSMDRYATMTFADINGDGKADVCARDKSNIKCWVSEGTKFSKAITGPSMATADKYNAVEYYSTIRFADVTGDGKDDVCARFIDGYKCFPSTGDGFGDAIALNAMSDAEGWNSPQYYSTIRSGDVNGDGKEDICGRDSTGVRCWLSDGTAFTEIETLTWSDASGWNAPKYYLTIRLADINGDGRADLCARDKDGIVCHLSQATSFGPAIRGPEWSDANGWNDYSYFSTIQLDDINHDGKNDICGRSKDGFICQLSNGNGFEKESKADFFSDANGWNKALWYRTIRLGDIDGDNHKDVCGRNKDGVSCFKFTGEVFESAVLAGPGINDSNGWNLEQYAMTVRFGGPKPACVPSPETCDQVDNDCDGAIDEDNVCCVPSEEVCDQVDNDCDGEIDEDQVCDEMTDCVPMKEICDKKDNDCDGEIDEDGVCDEMADCVPAKEICDKKDNDCDGEIDEDQVCDEMADCDNESCQQDQTDDYGYIDDGCSCSIRKTHDFSIGSAFFGLLGGAILLLRRRRNRMH